MNELESRMNDEQKAAMDEGYDMIVELMDYVKDNETSEARELLNDARGVLDLMNDVIYKTL